jgi:hypothetical protein
MGFASKARKVVARSLDADRLHASLFAPVPVLVACAEQNCRQRIGTLLGMRSDGLEEDLAVKPFLVGIVFSAFRAFRLYPNGLERIISSGPALYTRRS